MRPLFFFALLLCWGAPSSAQVLNPDPLDRLVETAIAEGETAGAVLLVGQGQETLFHKAYGHRQLTPSAELMTKETVFDLASLTKPVATASAVMWLVQEGKLTLKTRLADHLPGVDPRLTVEDLLLHRGGFAPDNPLADYSGSPEQAWQRLLAFAPDSKPGSRFVYSDVGYQLLGKLIELVDGRPLDQLCQEEFWEPLEMKNTSFSSSARDCAATYGRELGQVHDPRAFFLGGVSGHAGLFSTAKDLERYAQMLLGTGSLPLSVQTRQTMMARRGDRTYGFDVASRFASARGERFPKATSLGHTGFTGTSLWMDRASGVYVILLTNRLHPDNKGSVVGLRGAVATNVANQLLGPPVQTGIDVLAADDFSVLGGQRVGLITNHTGMNRKGIRTVDLLHNAKNVQLVRLFSPEHGLSGKHDSKVDDDRDQVTGLYVRSLYGESRKPDPAALDGIDVLVFDIQDVGCRFYTFISTMLYAMQAAKEANLKFVVLDRPNPIGGTLVDGWLASDTQLDFIACWPIPLVHGMTVGELARLFNEEVGVELNVVSLRGWNRAMTWDQTGLTWRAPSPNLRSLVQAHLYPAVGLLEWGNISVGRGTDTPFQRLGAPWIEDERRLAWDLNQLALPGVRFVPIRFTPKASVFAQQDCAGVELLLEDRQLFQPALTGLSLASYLSEHYPQSFALSKLSRHIANDEVLKTLEKGLDPEWELERFRQRRERVLLYSD